VDAPATVAARTPPAAAAGEALVAGIDVGGTKVLCVLVDPADPAEVVDEAKVRTPDGTAPVLDAMAGVVRELAGRSPLPVMSVGVGIAGLVDRSGVLRVGPNLPGLRDVQVGRELDDRLRLPVRVDNDATCAAWGEHLAGAARGVTDAVCVTLGTGIGAGIVADDELVLGAHGFAGEAGHMVVHPDGPACPCGQRGCWERFASGSGLGRLGREAAAAGRFPRGIELAGTAAAVQGEHVTHAAAEGDVGAMAVLADFAGWVALGLGNLVTLLDCSLVVIGGGVIEAGDVLMDAVRTAYPARVMSPGARPDVHIVGAELGERAGAIGAALLGGRDARVPGT
jgi:glucokinase